MQGGVDPEQGGALALAGAWPTAKCLGRVGHGEGVRKAGTRLNRRAISTAQSCGRSHLVRRHALSPPGRPGRAEHLGSGA
jgi:hypothetical protein